MTATTSEPAAIAWIRHEVGGDALLPDVTDDASLCAFLRDGRALCHLAAALSGGADALAMPKPIAKAMHQLSTFHSLERIHFFIRWCRATAKLEEHLVFTAVQLLDEQNADAVLACVDALRARFRPELSAKNTLLEPQENNHEEDETHESEQPHDPKTEDHETNNQEDDETPSPPLVSVASANKLSAFLTKVPSAPPSAPPPVVERSTSLSARLSGASLTGSTASSRHASSASITSDDAGDAVDTRARSVSSGSSSRSPRGSVAKLKLPGAFAALATVSVPTPEEPTAAVEEETPPPQTQDPHEPEVASTTPNRDAVDLSDEMIKNVSKLEIPPVFGRSTSLEDAAKSESVKRSVSKLRIPAAFSGAGADAGAPPPPVEEEPAPPVPEEPVSNSPKSKLAAFAKTLAPTPEPAPKPAEPEAPSKKKSTGKLKIPGVFGKAVGAAAPAPKKKVVTKLSAFLSTVENDVPPPIEAKPERRFAFPIPGTEEAKKPVQAPTKKATPAAAPTKVAAFAAFMQKVPVSAPKPAPRVERDVVPEAPADHHDEPSVPAVVENNEAPVASAVETPAEPAVASNKPSALLAFMQKVVVAPPAPAPRVERGDVSSEPTEDAKSVEDEASVEEVVVPAAVVVEEEAAAPERAPSPQKSNKLLAFLAAVESPTGSASEEEDNEEVPLSAVSAVSVDPPVESEDKDEGDDAVEQDDDEVAQDDDEEEEEDVKPYEDEELDTTITTTSAVSIEEVEVETDNDAPAEVQVVAETEIAEEPIVAAIADEPEPVAVPSEAALTSATPSVEVPVEEVSTHAVEDEDHDEEFANHVVESFPDHDVIVEVSGELTHEAVARRRLSSSCDAVPPRRSRSPSPVRSPKKETEASYSTTVADDTVVASDKTENQAETSMVLAEFEALKLAKKAVDAENESLQQQLARAETIAKDQNESLVALQAELAAVRAQLESQQHEAEAAQRTAIALVRQEFEAASARLASEHEAAITAAHSQGREEATAELAAKLAASESLAADRLEQLTALEREVADQQLVLAQSKESEEAARYAAQMAFAARDEAEEAARALEAKLTALTRAA